MNQSLLDEFLAEIKRSKELLTNRIISGKETINNFIAETVRLEGITIECYKAYESLQTNQRRARTKAKGAIMVAYREYKDSMWEAKNTTEMDLHGIISDAGDQGLIIEGLAKVISDAITSEDDAAEAKNKEDEEIKDKLSRELKLQLEEKTRLKDEQGVQVRRLRAQLENARAEEVTISNSPTMEGRDQSRMHNLLLQKKVDLSEERLVQAINSLEDASLCRRVLRYQIETINHRFIVLEYNEKVIAHEISTLDTGMDVLNYKLSVGNSVMELLKSVGAVGNRLKTALPIVDANENDVLAWIDQSCKGIPYTKPNENDGSVGMIDDFVLRWSKEETDRLKAEEGFFTLYREIGSQKEETLGDLKVTREDLSTAMIHRDAIKGKQMRKEEELRVIRSERVEIDRRVLAARARVADALASFKGAEKPPDTIIDIGLARKCREYYSFSVKQCYLQEEMDRLVKRRDALRLSMMSMKESTRIDRKNLNFCGVPHHREIESNEITNKICGLKESIASLISMSEPVQREIDDLEGRRNRHTTRETAMLKAMKEECKASEEKAILWSLYEASMVESEVARSKDSQESRCRLRNGTMSRGEYYAIGFRVTSCLERQRSLKERYMCKDREHIEALDLCGRLFAEDGHTIYASI